MNVTVTDLRETAEALLAESADGEPLGLLDETLIMVAVAVAVTSLDPETIANALTRAVASGANVAQIQEVVSLVSALGVHSLMMTAPQLWRLNAPATPVPLTAEQTELWQLHIGKDRYWSDFEQEFPGFLDALLRLSPDMFRQFHRYCAVPWTNSQVAPLVKELAAMAVDATPSHRFLPGFRLHLRHALRLGAGRAAVRRALDIAAAAPPHQGVA